jgi:hypothetical protein
MITLHVAPFDDLIEHEADPSCICGPKAEPVRLTGGSLAWALVHFSLDGREFEEGPTPHG